MKKISIALFASIAIFNWTSASAALNAVSAPEDACAMRFFNKNKELVGFLSDSEEKGFTLTLKENGQLKNFHEQKVDVKLSSQDFYTPGDFIKLWTQSDEKERAYLKVTVKSVCPPGVCDTAQVRAQLKIGQGSKARQYSLDGVEACMSTAYDPTQSSDFMDSRPQGTTQKPRVELSSEPVPAPIPIAD